MSKKKEPVPEIEFKLPPRASCPGCLDPEGCEILEGCLFPSLVKGERT